MSLRHRLIGNRRGNMPIDEPVEEPAPIQKQDDGAVIERLTEANTWLKSVAKKMIKKALKDTGKVILGKEDDHALISDGHFIAVIDGTFLDWFLGLEDCDTIAPPEAGSSVNKSVKEWFDELEEERAFVWALSNAYLLEGRTMRTVIQDAIGGVQLPLVLSVFGFAGASGSKMATSYTTWPFVHVIMPPTRKKDPHLVAGYDRTRFLFIQQDLARIFGDGYGSLKYTIRQETYDEIRGGKTDSQGPICVWSPTDKFMGLISRFNSDLTAASDFRWWQNHHRA